MRPLSMNMLSKGLAWMLCSAALAACRSEIAADVKVPNKAAIITDVEQASPRSLALTKLRGAINPLASASLWSKGLDLLICDQPTVSLVESSIVSGQWQNQTLATAAVDLITGTYQFEDTAIAALHVSLDSEGKIYQVQYNGCTEDSRDYYATVITNDGENNISFASTMIAHAADNLDPAAPEALAFASNVGRVAEILSALNSIDSAAEAYNALRTTDELRDAFEATIPLAVEALTSLAPKIHIVSIPSVFKEGKSHSLAVKASHWNPDYNISYQWKIENVFSSDKAVTSLSLKGNTQGQRTLQLLVGEGVSSASSTIDLNKPYRSQEQQITIDDTKPVSVPAFWVKDQLNNSNPVVTTSALTLVLETGTSLANCETFSALALTENSDQKPSSNAFTIECRDSPTQSVSYTFTTSGFGQKNLRLWARDSSGNISQAKILTVNYNNGQQLSIDRPNSSDTTKLSESSSYNVVYTASDTKTVSTLDLYYRNGSSSGCDDAGIAQWTQFANDLAEASGASVAFSPGTYGSYYICGKLTSSSGYSTFAVSSHPVLINDTPSFSFTEPMDDDDTVQQGVSFPITYNLVDADDAATVAFYYNTVATDCDATLTGWTLITSGASEGSSATSSWTAPVGTYYICAVVSDSLESSYAVSDTLVVTSNAAPTISIVEPAGNNDTIAESASFNIVYTGDDTDSVATVTLAYKLGSSANCNVGGFSGWTVIDNSLAEGTNVTQAFSPGSAGTYYICARIADAATSVYAVSAALVVNDAPTISISEPAGANDTIARNASFNITLAAADSDDAATINLYYKSTSGGACSTGTQIVTGLAENTTSYTWNTSGVAAGNYYICARITDSVNSAVEVWSSSYLHINANPTISLTSWTSAGEVQNTTGLTVNFTAADADNAAGISVYRKTSNSGACSSSGTLLTSALVEGTDTSYTWNTSSLTSGTYYLCFRINDGVNAAAETYTAAILVYRVCTWTGNVSTTWNSSTNWDCATVPDDNDRVLIPSGAVRQPTVATNDNVGGFAAGSGGGTVTVNSGITLNLMHGSKTFGSDVTLKGATANCSNCVVTGAYGGADIYNGATLTLSSGIHLNLFNHSLDVGASGSAGHFRTTAYTGTPSERPALTIQMGIQVTGTASQDSSVDLDGLVVQGSQISAGNGYIVFNSRYEIKKVDNVEFTPGGGGSLNILGMPALLFKSCSTGVFTATTYNNLSFKFLPQNKYSIFYDTASCTSLNMPVITVSGDGQGYGQLYEGPDADGRITWTNGFSYDCVWTGAVDTSWTDPGNWSGCGNNRGGYPTSADRVRVPAAPVNQPVVSSTSYIAAITSGVGGGTITISAGATLYLGYRSFGEEKVIVGNINFQGDSPACTTCEVRLWYQDSYVAEGATLGLGTGLRFRHNTYYGLYFGSRGSFTDNGHLITTHASATASEWPVIASLSTGTIPTKIVFRGKDTSNRSSINVNGLRLDGVGELLGATTYNGIEFSGGNWAIDGFDNVRINTINTTNSFDKTIIFASGCSSSTMTDKNWDGIDFIDGFAAAGRSIVLSSVSCATLPGGGTIELTPLTGGINAGYGAANEGDPGNLIDWN